MGEIWEDRLEFCGIEDLKTKYIGINAQKTIYIFCKYVY